MSLEPPPAAARGPAAMASSIAKTSSGDGCDSAAADSSCPALKALDPSNTSGKVLQYVQCQQDFCFEQCFNL